MNHPATTISGTTTIQRCPRSSPSEVSLTMPTNSVAPTATSARTARTTINPMRASAAFAVPTMRARAAAGCDRRTGLTSIATFGRTRALCATRSTLLGRPDVRTRVRNCPETSASRGWAHARVPLRRRFRRHRSHAYGCRSSVPLVRTVSPNCPGRRPSGWPCGPSAWPWPTPAR